MCIIFIVCHMQLFMVENCTEKGEIPDIGEQIEVSNYKHLQVT